MELSDVPSPNPERKRGKEKKKIKSYLGKNILRNTLETTKHKVCEQLKSWESRMKTEVFSVFSYKLKQETKHRFYINFF